ncbi:serine protease Do [Azospirillum lipoferum]|nr:MULTISPECIES: PDZ domain-containing protein [Azospirillum]MCP1615004.1 serine protease Do [Azospirillum lipoferum]MDW5532451.1 PDZ domain-containing protein [Azospirillum sp. NL1]
MAVLVVASGAAVLSGCAGDPVGLAIGAAGTVSAPSEASQVAETASYYRGTSCQALAILLQTNTDSLSSVPPAYRQSMSINVQALRQVMAEQRCPATGAGAVSGVGSTLAPSATVGSKGMGGAVTGTPPGPATVQASEPQGKVGMSVAPVTAQVAQAVGLEAPRGLVVMELMPGQAADVSGIWSGDVILEVRGVVVGDPVQMRRVLGVVPDGQSVTVKLWRGRELREVVVGPVASNTPALPAGVVYADAPALAASVRERSCVAQLMTSGTLASGVRSSLFTVRNNGSEAESAKVTAAFLLAAQKAQPGKWLTPHPRPNCNRDSTVCTSVNTDSEILTMLCRTEREEGARVYESLRQSRSLTELAWSPPP